MDSAGCDDREYSRGRHLRSQPLAGAIIVLDPVIGSNTPNMVGTVLHESQSVYDTKGRLLESFGPPDVSTRYDYDSFRRQIFFDEYLP